MEALATSPVVRAVDANGLSLLSKREMDVVRSLAEGLTNREIAERLGLSQHTIKNYLFRVYDKLGVSSRLELLFMTLTQAGAKPSGHAWRRISGSISGEVWFTSRRARTRSTAPRKHRTALRNDRHTAVPETANWRSKLTSGIQGRPPPMAPIPRNRSAGLKRFPQAAHHQPARCAKRDQSDFGWAVETHRQPDRSNSNVGVQGERTNAPQSPGYFLPITGRIGRTQ